MLSALKDLPEGQRCFRVGDVIDHFPQWDQHEEDQLKWSSDETKVYCNANFGVPDRRLNHLGTCTDDPSLLRHLHPKEIAAFLGVAASYDFACG